MVKGSFFGEIEIIQKINREFSVVCKLKTNKFYYINRYVKYL